MADIPIDGKVRVSAVPAIADISAPTTTELNAGILLQTTMTADGLVGFQPDTAAVSTSSLASTFDTSTVGRASFSGMMLRLKKQTGTDTIWNTLVRGYEFYVVLRRYVEESDAWASDDQVQVYPAICGETKDLDPEPNSLGRYEVPIFLTSEPDLRSVVA
jgi:hypothetical protein